jgi:hypothetical protein
MFYLPSSCMSIGFDFTMIRANAMHAEEGIGNDNDICRDDDIKVR